MIKFTYNNTKNQVLIIRFIGSNTYIIFAFFLKIILIYTWNWKLQKKLSFKLQKLIVIYQQNFYLTQKLKIQAYDREIKLSSYVSGDKI